MSIRFNAFFSVDSAKAIKANEYGYLNGINYMAPHSAGGVGNLCSHASVGCIALCLGMYSGQASMVADLENGTNSVRDSRKAKAQYFMNERQAFLNEMVIHVAKLVRKASKNGLTACVRPNGSTDLAWEAYRIDVTAETAAAANRALAGTGCAPIAAGWGGSIMTLFPTVQFVDYTKNPARMRRNLPANYHLTFSRAESNEVEALGVLASGKNVAVVFADSLPTTWHGFPVVDGDKHDLRHLDPRGNASTGGYVIGLLPKGNKAKRDTSGFVLRLAA